MGTGFRLCSRTLLREMREKGAGRLWVMVRVFEGNWALRVWWVAL